MKSQDNNNYPKKDGRQPMLGYGQISSSKNLKKRKKDLAPSLCQLYHLICVPLSSKLILVSDSRAQNFFY